MRTIETMVTVTDDGKITVHLPPDIPPGEHHVVMVIDEQPVKKGKRPPLDFPVMSVGSWPEISLYGGRTCTMNGGDRKIFLDTNMLLRYTSPQLHPTSLVG